VGATTPLCKPLPLTLPICSSQLELKLQPGCVVLFLSQAPGLICDNMALPGQLSLF
jgi:hypothetical protein